MLASLPTFALPSRQAVWALLLACTVACLTVADVRAQRVTAALSADSVTVGERFFLSVVVERGIMAEPVFPVFTGDSTRLGDLQVIGEVSRSGAYGGAAQPGTRTDTLIYEVAAFAVDTAFVPPILVRFTSGQDTFAVASRGGLFVPVTSVVPPDAAGLQDLAPLAEFPRPLWFWLVMLLLVGLLAAALYYVWKRRRRRTAARPTSAEAPSLPPYEEATMRLRRLEETDLHAPDAIKGFYVELSDVLRTYLARRLGTRAKERTTRELVRDLQQLAGASGLPGDVAARVRRVLELADYAKFADARPPAEEGRRALEETRATLDQVEEALRPEPEPEAVATS